MLVTKMLDVLALSKRWTNLTLQQGRTCDRAIRLFAFGGCAILLTGCGTLTGIPSHGGGKRFAVEQEMISASARAAAKDLDLSALAGRKVALFVTVIGDEGSGTLTGGRYTLDALVRGEYINSPTTTTRNQFPVVPTTAVTESGGVTTTTTAQSALNAPRRSETETQGGGQSASAGVRVGGQGDYRNETLITNPRDVNYLTNLLQTVFFLRGIEVVPPAQADSDAFITVDVFGTIRSRTEWHVSNQERLIAATKFEAFAVDRKTREVIMTPRVSAYEAKYEERFALWVGPISVSKDVKKSSSLLVNFSDIQGYGSSSKSGGAAPSIDETIAPQQRSNTDPAIIRERRSQ